MNPALPIKSYDIVMLQQALCISRPVIPLIRGMAISESQPKTAGSTDQDEQSREGEIFDLLSNQRRRYTIHYCKREGEAVTLGDLAEHVAAWELDKEVEAITSAERKRVYTSLQQTHLPTLERADMIEFDDRTIELTDEAAELDVYLDIVPGDSVPWGVYYLGLTAVGLIVMGGVVVRGGAY